MPSCVLRYCTNNSTNTAKCKGITFHRFPRLGRKDREKWIKFVQNNRSEESWLPSNHTYVCSLHFREKDLYTTEAGRRFLKKAAVPCVDGLDNDDSNSDLEDTPGTSSQNVTTNSCNVFIPKMGSNDAIVTDVQNCEDLQAQASTSVLLTPKEDKSLKRKGIENRDSALKGKEIKVFCPKCNTEVAHTATGIQEDQKKIFVAQVYHYFEQEFEELKKMYGDVDLTPLSRFQQRTALATGVSETTVLRIMKEEQARNANKQQEPPTKERRAPKRSRQMDSSSEEDSSDDNVDDGGQESFAEVAEKEPEIETLVVKIEPIEYHKDEPQIDPIMVEVKAEPPDDDVNSTNETPALNEPAETKRKGRKIPRTSDVTSTLQPTQGESSTAAPARKDRLAEALLESGLLGGTEIKLENIEIEEEGFS